MSKNVLGLFAGLYALTAKLSRWCAALAGICGFVSGTLAVIAGRDLGGLGPLQLYSLGFIAAVLLLTIGAALAAAGKYLRHVVPQ